jgi:hypothetical protein
MRLTAIILAILGAVLSLGLGMKWRGDYNDLKSLRAAAR